MKAPDHASRGLPEAPSPFPRRLAVIMAADVAGYSRLMADAEEDTLALFQACRDLFAAEVERYGGRIFNTAGDAIMSEFSSAVEAVRAAIAIQHAVAAHNSGVPEQRRLHFRIGVHVGDAIERNGDLFGDGVNVAARLEGLARAGGVCVSRSVHDAVSGKIAMGFRNLGPQRLKNIPIPVEAYWALLAPGDEAENGACPPQTGNRASAAPARRSWRRPATYAAVLLAAVIISIPTLQHARQLLEAQLGLRTARHVNATQEGRTAAEPAPQPQAPSPATPGANDRKAAAARAMYDQGRRHEAEGRTGPASVAYAEAARVGAGYVDPPQRLAALVQLRDGARAAREVLADLGSITKDPALRLTYLQQLDAATRVARLKRLAEDNRSFSPALYAYGMALGDERTGQQTLARLQAEKKALRRFLDSVDAGTARRYFLDDSLLQEWTERARTRVREIAAALQGHALEPTLSWNLASGRFTVNVTLPENAVSVEYRPGDVGDYSRADQPPASGGEGTRTASFTLPAPLGETTLYIVYTDTNGISAGPFAYPFAPEELARRKEQELLLATSGSWVTWASDRDELFFPYLLAHRCVIRSASIGFDGAAPDMPLPLSGDGCDQGLPPPPGAQASIPAPHNAQSVTIRLVLANGEAAPPLVIARDQ